MGHVNIRLNVPREEGTEKPLAEIHIDATPAEVLQAAMAGQAVIAKLKSMVRIRNGRVAETPE